MKKTLFNALLCSLLLSPAVSYAQSTVQDGQSTEGKDFWVTFLKADQDANNDITLSLSISARENSEVLISNPYTGYVSDTIKVEAGKLQTVDLYTGSTTGSVQRASDGGKTCYSFNSESVDTCALHVVSTGKISLFASNYKKATFDATNVLPTPSLLDSYVIQTYSPSDHKPESVNSPAAGSHFAIVAAEDDVIVDITLSAQTYDIKPARRLLQRRSSKVRCITYGPATEKDRVLICRVRKCRHGTVRKLRSSRVTRTPMCLIRNTKSVTTSFHRRCLRSIGVIPLCCLRAETVNGIFSVLWRWRTVQK